jgi:hypothetical protein
MLFTTPTAATSGSTPWWGVPVLAGIFALVGVLLAQLVAYQLEQSRRQREDQRRRADEEQRWDKNLVELYARYLVEIRDFVTAAGLAHLTGKWPDLARLDQTFQEIRLLVRHQELAQAAFDVQKAAMLCMADVLKSQPVKQRWLEELPAQGERFFETCRATLGLPELELHSRMQILSPD